ncbi:hypothetical protein ACWDA3_55880 [Nonomuraea rubra]
MTVRALARCVLKIPELAGADPDPLAALSVIFGLLESGWPGLDGHDAGPARQPERADG